MSFSDGGGEPSIQPFQPFLTATRFLRGSCAIGRGRLSRSSSSLGVRGRLDDVREVLDELEGPGVEEGEDAIGGSEWGMGGGVTETERCVEAR